MSTKTQDPVIGDGSLHVGDRVVYPNQGICRITGVEIKQIAGQNWEVVTLSREEDGATVKLIYENRGEKLGVALRATARWSFLLFWLAYAGGALATLFGPKFQALARRGRDFGLSFASGRSLITYHFWPWPLPDHSCGLLP